MVTYGYPGIELADELELAAGLGVSVLEVLPEWGQFPDPARIRAEAANHGLTIHSAHGCWGGRTIRAGRVDLGAPDPRVHRDSIDDLKRCADWLEDAGGTCLVVHPGGLSDRQERLSRRAALAKGLHELAEHVAALRVRICVENMPPGVHPGSRMADLVELLTELDHPKLALALDTGHAHLSHTLAEETHAAGARLATTHVHDNHRRQDSHGPPGFGTIDWPDWGRALDAIAYSGPIVLECIRYLRQKPDDFNRDVLRGICVSATEAG
jgi:sugar phosphate isomerase/epimerase